VADAGTEKTYRWSNKLSGPGGVNLAMGIAGASMGSASRTGYDAMRLQLEKWEADLVEFRCSLSLSEVRRYHGSTRGWNCRDLKFFVGLVSFDALDEDQQTELNEIPTRLKLKTEQVDMAIEAGRMAARLNPELNGFLRASPGRNPLVAIRGEGNKPRRISPVQN
jgi:NTE family protein